MSAAILQEIAAFEARAEKRLAALHDRISQLALAILAHHQGSHDMSALTDAIKSDLSSLETKVDDAAAKFAKIAEDASAAEQADLAEIKTHIESLGSKVDAMAPPVTPAPVVS